MPACSIMVAPAPHLNGDYTIFGEAVDGFEVRVVQQPDCVSNHS
jgi:cyclophilin family peptidyl-prolyl cis-trans isomerase